MPSTLAPGTYDATASCSVSEAGTSAYYDGFTVTITPRGTGVAGASGAAPTSGAPRYTG